MNTKILISLATIGIASAGLGYGTYAFFSDTEKATGNIFTAGDLDLTLNGFNGITGTIIATNFAPGDVTTGSIMLRNVGSVHTGDAQGHLVDLDMSALVNVTDDTGVAGDIDNGGVSGNGFARNLTLTTFSYGSVNLLPFIGDRDSDGRANTLADLALSPSIKDLADPGDAGQQLSLTVKFEPTGPNNLKRDQATIDFTFFLSQSSEADL